MSILAEIIAQGHMDSIVACRACLLLLLSQARDGDLLGGSDGISAGHK
jgi:hypothetical protein